MEISKRLLMVVLIASMGLVACATGPREQLSNHQKALSSKNAEELSALMTLPDGRHVDASSLMEALQKGWHSDPPSGEAWSYADVTATVKAGKDTYLLSEINGEWTIRCSTFGPFHKQSPEMVLLLARHLIQKKQYDRLKSLLPNEMETSKEPVPQDFRSALDEWASLVAYEVCQPFEITGTTAKLTYGPDKKRTITMELNGSSWRIRDLW